MRLTPEEQLTINSYNSQATSWARSHSDANFWNIETPQFRKLLPSGKILEIGCGGGRDASELIQAGYSYVGTDVAPEFVKIAQQRNPQGEFSVQSIYELDFPDHTFDGFWASAVLLHIPKKRIDAALAKIHQVVRPGGIGFISIKQGSEEKLKEDKSSDGNTYHRLWSYYQDGEFREILSRNKFKILEHSERTTGDTHWLVYLVERS